MKMNNRDENVRIDTKNKTHRYESVFFFFNVNMEIRQR